MEKAVKVIEQLPLADAERLAVLGGNAARLLKLDQLL
jgi:predicted TIM-barrel fold metal-dependent hydrolase